MCVASITASPLPKIGREKVVIFIFIKNPKKRQVSPFVKVFNSDGRTFIRSSAQELLKTDTHVEMIPSKPTSSSPRLKVPASTSSTSKPTTTATTQMMTSPKTFNHYILNLPASAITFLPSFIGLYAGQEELFTDAKLPVVHVHCFSTKSDDNKDEGIKICRDISEQIRYEMKPGDIETEGEVQVWDVRDVAPLKRMFCASFRLPEKVAFGVVGNRE